MCRASNLGAAGLALAILTLAGEGQARPVRVFIGTYTPNPTAAPAPARAPSTPDFTHGLGIYVAEVDDVTGAMSEPRLAARTLSPTWLVLGPRRDMLYAANETRNGTVSAFRIDQATGALTLLNSTPTGGSPVSLAVHGSGNYLFAANYGGGSVAVLPIRADGSLGPATDVEKTFSGTPEGRVHMVGADHGGQFVVANEAALDRVFFWRLDETRGTLLANNPPSFAVPGGAFPRHFVFSPDDRFFYNLSERDSMLSVAKFSVSAGAARLAGQQRISTLPPTFTERNQTSELLITRDGKRLYAANRGHDSIAVFAAAPDGSLTRMGNVGTGGAHPRTLALDPAERFLFALNQHSDTITTFKVDAATGMLQASGRAVAIPSPASIVFVPPE